MHYLHILAYALLFGVIYTALFLLFQKVLKMKFVAIFVFTTILYFLYVVFVNGKIHF